jgi:hypothetical protein
MRFLDFHSFAKMQHRFLFVEQRKQTTPIMVAVVWREEQGEVVSHRR